MTDALSLTNHTYGTHVFDEAPAGEMDPIAQERYASLPLAAYVQIYREYAKGRQCLSLTDEQRDTLDGLPIAHFADNVIGQILNINKDRLKVTEFTVDPPDGLPEEAGQAEADAVLAFINNLRIKARFDAEANKIHKAVLRDGNHYAGLAWDDDTQRIVIVQEPAWDGYSGMYMAYGENGLPAYAVKEWVATESELDTNGAYSGMRGVVAKFAAFVSGLLSAAPATKTYRYRTIYYPDRIEKYRQESGGMGKWEALVREGEPYPLPWQKRDGSPLGIPVVHFSVGGDSYYGDTITPLEVIANQDLLNDTRLDLAGVGRQTGFQRVCLAGFPDYQKNADGTPDYQSPIPYRNQPGMFYITENAAARAQVLEPGDPAGLINIYNLTLESMCRQTQTPFFLVSIGSNSTGAAILRAEAPLAGKAQEQTESLGPSYATLLHRAVEIYNAKNKAGVVLREDALITPVWADTSKPDAMAVVEFDKAKADLRRAEMVLEQEQKAIDEGRPIFLPTDDLSKRLAAVLPVAPIAPVADPTTIAA